MHFSRRYSKSLMATAFMLSTVAVVGMQSCKRRPEEASDIRFGSGEHKWLGDSSYETACQASRSLCSTNLLITRKDGKESYSYGDLVAFSGDFFEGPEDLYDKAETLLGRIENKKYVMSHFEKQVEAINKMYHHGGNDYPENDFKVAISIPQYGLLAMDNDGHFGWHNMVKYVEHHQAALNIAHSAHGLKNTNLKAAKAQLERAIFINAFADHFLSDAFAAGHIRVPRTQMKTWANTRRYIPSLGGTIAKVIHDFDGKVGKHYPKGINVVNAEGKAWATRVDAELFLRLESDKETVDMPVKAMELSLAEVFTAYEEGKVPEGIFAATMLVPVVDPSKEVSLSERYKRLTDKDIEEMTQAEAWFSKIPVFTKVLPAHIKQLVKDLPGLMKEFSQQVRNQVKANAQLSRRLPKSYIDYFSSIE